VTPECAPITKTGGLGDVSEALPAALRALGVDVRILIPGYEPVLRALDGLSATEELLQAGNFIVVNRPALYRREGGPYQDARGRDWPDNAVRFGELCKAAAAIAQGALDWHPDVVHCNDWPAGLFPALAPDVPSVMTVHNLAFQGNFELSLAGRFGLSPAMPAIEFYGRLSFLKAGLACATAITTVSPTYAREILTPEFGCGMDGLLRHREAALTGIVNGIDTTVWNPASDKRITQGYDAACIEKKSINKTVLQRRLRLEESDAMLFGMVSRLTGQKGIDLVLEAIDELPGQLAVLGTGNHDLEQALAAAAARHPGRVAFVPGFDEDLAHLVEAGADAFLMPSRYEPCGLNQMYSQRYGTPPVARATGGLADTIEDGVSGFLFKEADAKALLAAARRARQVFDDPARWRAVQRAGMARDFSWEAPARRYAALYSRLASAAQPRRPQARVLQA
jgi:starch synthase